MYTVDELFNSRGDARANVRQWLRVERVSPGRELARLVGIDSLRMTPLGIAALTMAGGQMGSTIIKIPANVLVQLFSAEP